MSGGCVRGGMFGSHMRKKQMLPDNVVNTADRMGLCQNGNRSWWTVPYDLART